MPELPEVQTTVNGINRFLKNLKIKDVWTDYQSPHHVGKPNIKDRKYFSFFKKTVIGKKIIEATRIGKNVLIHLSDGQTIAIHMKMTGHLLYGRYIFKNKTWIPHSKESEALKDPFNKFIHLVFIFSNGKHLAFSDMRKFGKVFVTETKTENKITELEYLGPDPLSPTFTFSIFKKVLEKQPKGKIKQVLMNQEIIAGIGNIYSDEILWKSGVHPLSIVSKIPEKTSRILFSATKEILKKGIDFGGDSMSDYRNIKGERGRFQHTHNAYRLTGKPCKRKGCKGTIRRIKVGGRSAHYCSIHQKLFK